ncbi:DEAD/DEAH box helicase, partial [Candidatus Babeliales bacterium]|nr:DEAD/DEAH box helicase [Candidatus Babeliales bacterium]
MFKLRDYQEDIKTLIRNALKTSKSVIACAPTRSGKTVVFADIAKRMENAEKKVLILTHRQEILEQIIKALTNMGISSGQIVSGKYITKNLIMVGMIQTVHNKLKKQDRMVDKFKFKSFEIIEKPDLIIGDEVHHCVSKTWKEVFLYFGDVPRIGFTATPERLDGSGLCELFEKLVIGRSTKWMVDNYWLSKPVHLCPQSPLDKASLKMRMGDYDKQSMSEIMKKHVVCADVVKSYREFFDGAPVIVFCCTIDHAEQMMIAYKNDNWNPVLIHGKMKSKQRNEAMTGFRDGVFNQLISVDLIGEGIDVPVCSGVQLLRKTASLSLYLQMSARGLTPVYADGYDLENYEQRKTALQKGKPEAIILDHAGNYWAHGSITKVRDWSINHKKRNNKEKNVIKKVTCPTCFFDWEIEIKKCPNCNHDFDVARNQKKEFEMHELKEKLVNVNEIEEMEAESLSKVILRIKDYSNSKNAMFAILHQKIKDGENNMKHKIDAMCSGLGYKDGYKHRVWSHL